MTEIVNIAASAVLAFSGIQSAHASPEIGSINEDGRIFLFREPVEIYWNDWTGVALNKVRYGQADVYVKSEAKTGSFDGVLGINCESRSGYQAHPIHHEAPKFIGEALPRPIAGSSRFILNE